jgi:hypothetical protein
MWGIVGKVLSRAFQRYTTYGPCDRYMTCRDVFKVNQVPHRVRCRWKGLVKSIPTMHDIRPLWTFSKRWHKKFTKRWQRLNNVDTAFTKRYWSCSETVPPLGYTRLNGLLVITVLLYRTYGCFSILISFSLLHFNVRNSIMAHIKIAFTLIVCWIKVLINIFSMLQKTHLSSDLEKETESNCRCRFITLIVSSKCKVPRQNKYRHTRLSILVLSPNASYTTRQTIVCSVQFFIAVGFWSRCLCLGNRRWLNSVQ